MGETLTEIGWWLTKYVTLPILAVGILVWWVMRRAE